MKSKGNSWSDNRIHSENYIASKRVDSSTFGAGTVIPVDIRGEFLSNISIEMKKGDKHKINLLCEGKIYYAKLDWVNNDEAVRTDTVIRIMFNDKKFVALLIKKLGVSYSYIKEYMKENNNKKPKVFPEEVREYIDFYKGDEVDTFVVKLIDRDSLEDNEGNSEVNEDVEDINVKEDIVVDYNEVYVVNQIHKFIQYKGYFYEIDIIKNLYTSLKAKPFVILSGISGTGKSKIAELFAAAIGATEENGRFNLVSVKPDWSDATDLLGYRNINGDFTAGVITSIAYEAILHPELPYFICLDEMNLARVEYYFSDILSKIETRRVNEYGQVITSTLVSKEYTGTDSEAFDNYGDVYLPENLYIIGTVNMDETTFPFSKKVLDRANTIEFNKVNLDYSFDYIASEDVEAKNYHNNFLKSEFLKISDCVEYKDIAKKVIGKLIEINKVLEKYNQHFGYRVRDEIVFYMIYATRENLLDFDTAFDLAVTQKILPKISGSSQEVQDLLINLFNSLNKCSSNFGEYIEEADIDAMQKNAKSNFKLTNEKIIYMIRRFIRDGFTTYWQ